jgi:uncharacterized cupredoxin-like copper-binding protein
MGARRIAITLAVLGLSGGFLAGCGEDRKAGGTSSTGTGGETQAQTIKKGPLVGAVAINETEYKLTPVKPTAKQAGLVEFRVQNSGKVVHALEVVGPNGEQKTGQIQPGKSATLRVDLGKAGTYDMYCPIDNHKGKGMEGLVAVAGGGFGAAKQSGTDTSEKGAGTGGKAPEQSPSGGGSGY